MINKNYVNEEVTKEEMQKIKTAIESVGKFGQIDLVVSNGIIDLIVSKRERIRDGKKDNYNKG